MSVLQPLTTKIVGVVGLMASRDIVRTFSRTSVTIAALMVSVSVIIGVGVMISSFRTTVVTWLDNVLQADIFVTPANQATGSTIDSEFMQDLADYPDVSMAVPAYIGTTLSDEYGPVEIRAYGISPLVDSRDYLWRAAASQVISTANNIVISEVFARNNKLPIDQISQISLITNVSGPHTFNVVGVFYDYASPQGFIAMDLETYQSLWEDKRITNVAIFAEPDVDIPMLVEDLQTRFAGFYQLRVVSNRGIKDEALVIFDRTFTITATLRLLATVVAFIGILSALMSMQLERTRELGTLRASGLTIRQLWGLTLTQTALIGLIAGVIAIPTGLVLAIILIYVINLRSFGWSLQLVLEPQIFLFALLIALIASISAGIYPSYRMSKLEIASALREE